MQQTLNPALRSNAPARAWEVLRARVPVRIAQIGMLFSALAALPFTRTVDNDYWYHVRTGRLILESGIPHHDPYSWTALGKSWVPHEWLAEVVMYATQSLAGFAGVVVLLEAATLGALTLPYLLARRAGAGSRPLVALMLVVVVAFATFEPIRPQAFTWLLFSVFLFILNRHDQGERAPVWALPPLMTVWANTHLGFWFGLMLVGCWAAAGCLDAVRGRRIGTARTPVLVAAACLVAACVHPSGPEILWYPLRFAVQSPAGTAAVHEFQAPNILNPMHAPIFITAALLLATLASRQRPRPFLFLVTLVVVALSMKSARHGQFSALVLLPVCGAALAERWEWARRDRDSDLRLPVPAVAAAMTGILLLTGSLTLMNIGGGISLIQPGEKGYPAAGARYIDEHHRGERMYNDFNAAHFLIYNLYPDTRVFFDGRFDFYGNALSEDYLLAYAAAPGWPDVMDRYGVEVVLIAPSVPLARAMARHPSWEEEFRGPNEVVFARR